MQQDYDQFRHLKMDCETAKIAVSIIFKQAIKLFLPQGAPLDALMIYFSRAQRRAPGETEAKEKDTPSGIKPLWGGKKWRAGTKLNYQKWNS